MYVAIATSYTKYLNLTRNYIDDVDAWTDVTRNSDYSVRHRCLYNKYILLMVTKEDTMPHLKIRGIDKAAVIARSKDIVDGISSIVDCPRDWVTIEHQATEYIFDGAIVDGYTFAEVYWFERPEEIKRNVATFLTKLLKEVNGNKDCCIIFFPMEGKNYCDNGEFF